MKELGAIFLALMQIALLVMTEVFSGKARTRAEDEEHDKKIQAQFKLITEYLSKIRDRARKESSEAQSAEDEREQDMQKERESHDS